MSYFNMQYLKRKHFSYRIQLHTGKVWFIWKKLKKSHFYFFLSKFLLTWCLQSQIFQICAKKFKNWVALCFGNVLKLKVTKGKLDISIWLEMADDYRLGGAVMFVDFYQLYLLMNGNRFYKQLIVYAINILLQFLLSQDKQ